MFDLISTKTDCLHPKMNIVYSGPETFWMQLQLKLYREDVV